MTSHKPFLFQYWDEDEPPQDVETQIATWRNDASFTHRMYNRRTAEEYVARHVGERARAAFRLCAYGAMQADLFRYAALWTEGGIYMDADQGNKRSLHDLLAPAETGLLMTLLGSFANGLIFVREPRSDLIGHVLEVALRNIEGRLSNNVSEVTGSMIFDRLYEDPATRPLFDGFLLVDWAEVRMTVRFKRKFRYKQTAAHWRHAAFTRRVISIFREDG